MLIRPIAIGLGVVMAALAWLGARHWSHPRRAAAAALLIVGNLVAVAPWQTYVYARTGKIVPLCSNGVPAILDGVTFAVNDKGYRQGLSVPDDVRTLMQEVFSQRAQLQSPRAAASAVAAAARERPQAAAKLLAIKIARSWYGTDSQRWETPLLAVQLVYLAALVWASWRAWNASIAIRRANAGAWILVLYFWGMNVVGLTLVRYLAPVMGLLFVTLPALGKTQRETDSLRP